MSWYPGITHNNHSTEITQNQNSYRYWYSKNLKMRRADRINVYFEPPAGHLSLTRSSFPTAVGQEDNTGHVLERTRGIPIRTTAVPGRLIYWCQNFRLRGAPTNKSPTGLKVAVQANLQNRVGFSTGREEKPKRHHYEKPMRRALGRTENASPNSELRPQARPLRPTDRPADRPLLR